LARQKIVGGAGLIPYALSIGVNRGFTIFRRSAILFAAIALLLLTGTVLSGALLAATVTDGRTAPAAAGAPAAGPRAQAPSIAQALESGVLIVISKASQRMQVFKDGGAWLWSPVSTGRRGHSTPAGVFPVLEKQRFHRSNLYSNAPMPFMQRLTMGGIAIHAGYVPNHPASHGCIRVPYAVARSLFGLTRTGATTVVIMNEPMHNDAQARQLALAFQQPATASPAPSALARATLSAPTVAGPPAPAIAEAPPAPVAGQTIQLAAALSPQEAEARWTWLVSMHADLARFDKTVVPVVVRSHRYFRLRASGPGAFSTCSQLRSAGLECFRVL
jgi:hypothetical protein